MEPTGPNGAIVLPGNPRSLAFLSPYNNPVGPGFRTVHLGTIIFCKTNIKYFTHTHRVLNLIL